jgi:hypothetical protein
MHTGHEANITLNDAERAGVQQGQPTNSHITTTTTTVMMIWTGPLFALIFLAYGSCSSSSIGEGFAAARRGNGPGEGHWFFDRVHVLNPAGVESGGLEAGSLMDKIEMTGLPGSECGRSSVAMDLRACNGQMSVARADDGFIAVFRTGLSVLSLYPFSPWEGYKPNALHPVPRGSPAVSVLGVRPGDIVFAVVPRVRDWPMDRLALQRTIEQLQGEGAFMRWAGNLGSVLHDDRATVLVAKIGWEQEAKGHSAKLMHSCDATVKMDPLLYDQMAALSVGHRDVTLGGGKDEEAAEGPSAVAVVTDYEFLPRPHAFLEQPLDPFRVRPADAAGRRPFSLPVPKVGPPKPVFRSSLDRKFNQPRADRETLPCSRKTVMSTTTAPHPQHL